MKVSPADLPGITRIAIGEMRESKKGGAMIPAKSDYIRLCKGNPSRTGKTRYIPDEQLTAILQEHLEAIGEPDPQKPQRIPVSVLGNLIEGPDGTMQVPPHVLQSGLAYFWGGRRDCYCNEFRLKTQDEAAEDGIAWPLEGDDMGNYIGTAHRKRYDHVKKEVTVSGKKQVIDIPVLRAIEQIPCNPSICPLFQGTHDVKKYEGKRLCKPRVKLAVYLPWAPTIGPIAQFTSTSWHSARYIESTLLNIGGHTHGWLALMPLWLNLGWSKISTRDGVVPVSYLYFSAEGEPNLLRLKAAEVQQEYAASEAPLKQLAAGSEEMLDVADDQEPDLYPDIPQESIDERGRRLEEFAVSTLGWSSAKFAAEWDATGGDLQAAIALEREMEAQLIDQQARQRLAKRAQVAREAKEQAAEVEPEASEPEEAPEEEAAEEAPEEPVADDAPVEPPTETEPKWQLSQRHR
jgi:hypothetical protein